MTLLYAVVCLAVILAIAAAVIGREAHRLDAEAPRVVFDPDEAVEWVANHLLFEISAELSHADVRQVLDWNLEYFKSKGVSANGSTPHIDTPIVVGGAETVDYVLNRARLSDVPLTSPQAHAVLEAQMGYLEAIGAIGPQARPEENL